MYLKATFKKIFFVLIAFSYSTKVSISLYYRACHGEDIFFLCSFCLICGCDSIQYYTSIQNNTASTDNVVYIGTWKFYYPAKYFKMSAKTIRSVIFIRYVLKPTMINIWMLFSGSGTAYPSGAPEFTTGF
jgi:hypothetical protein